jgi:uncharacterized membrane protein
MSQTVWNTGHGNFFVLTGEDGTVSRFSIHADLILILLAPLYYIWENVRILLITQSLLLALGAIPVYLLSKKLLKSIYASFVFVGVYLLHPSLEWANIYDFHTITIAIPLLLSTFYFAYIKKWKLFTLFAMLSLLCREDIGLIIAGLGVIMFFLLHEKIKGLITVIIGGGWFSFMAAFVIPHFSKGDTGWLTTFYQYGSVDSYNFFTTLQNVFAKGGALLFTSYALHYYISILKPFAFLPLLGLPFILPSMPPISVNVLSQKNIMVSTILHYEAGIIPFFLIASIFGFFFFFSLIKKIPYTKRHYQVIFISLLSLLVLYILRDNYANDPLPISPNCFCQIYNVTTADNQFSNLLGTIPRNAIISASPEIRAHLTRRVDSYVLPYGINKADYIAIIDQNRLIGDFSPKTYELQLLQKLVNNINYILVGHVQHFYLFKRLTPNATP